MALKKQQKKHIGQSLELLMVDSERTPWQTVQHMKQENNLSITNQIPQNLRYCFKQIKSQLSHLQIHLYLYLIKFTKRDM